MYRFSSYCFGAFYTISVMGSYAPKLPNSLLPLLFVDSSGITLTNMPRLN